MRTVNLQQRRWRPSKRQKRGRKAIFFLRTHAWAASTKAGQVLLLSKFQNNVTLKQPTAICMGRFITVQVNSCGVARRTRQQTTFRSRSEMEGSETKSDSRQNRCCQNGCGPPEAQGPYDDLNLGSSASTAPFEVASEVIPWFGC